MIKFALINTPTFNSTKPDEKPQLFVPDIDFIGKFFSGDIAQVSDVYHRGFDIETKLTSLVTNVSGMDYTDVDIVNSFIKSSGAELNNEIETYEIDGKFKFTTSDFKINESSFTSGMSALQKMILQTTFETQKPYMEIVKLVTDNFLLIEDIICNALCIVQKSKNPRTNPKALNYQSNKETLQLGLSKLDFLTKLDTSVKPQQFTTIDNLPSIDSKIVSIEYSTGDYDPNIQYEYTYKHIYELDVALDGVENIYDEDEDEDQVYKDIVIFGVFDEEGNRVNEEDLPNWIKRSPKYIGEFEMFNDGKYIWKNNITGATRITREAPSGSGWYKKTYKTTFKINGESHYYTEPIINYTESKINLENIYLDMYVENAKLKNPTLNVDDLIEVLTNGASNTDDLNKKSTISTHIDLMIQNCFLNRYNGPSVPLPRNPFLPKKIDINGDEVYIDPETDYDMRIIKFTPVTKSINEVIVQNKSIQEMSGLYAPVAIYGEDEKHTITNKEIYQEGSDLKTYYIVEGIHSTVNNTQPSEENFGSNSSGKTKDYKKIHIFKLIPKFIKLIVKLAVKLYPTINDFITLLSNPNELPSFLTKPLFNKMGDNNGTEDTKFDVYSKEFMDEYSKMKNMLANNGSYEDYVNNISSTTNISESEIREKYNEKLEETRNYVNDSILKEYVHIDDDNQPKLLIDTSYATSIFGIDFSLALIDYKPEVKITNKSVSEYKTEIQSYIDNDNVKEASKLMSFVESIYGKNVDVGDLETQLDDMGYMNYMGVENSTIVSQSLEMIATPIKIVEKIINKIVNFFKSLVNPFMIVDAVQEFLTFKWLTDLIKPQSFLELLGIKFDLGKYTDALNLSKYQTDISFDELVSVSGTKVSAKDIKANNIVDADGAANEIVNLGIKEVYNITELSDVSFFTSYLDKVGMNMETYTKYTSIVNGDGTIDMNEILTLPFIPKLPSYNIQDMNVLGFAPIDNALKSTLVVIQSLMNSFIDLVFSLFGLGAKMDIPHINLTNMLATNYIDNIIETDDVDMFKNILNNMDNDVIEKMVSGYETGYLFDMSLSNGLSYSDLTYYDLVNKIVENNVEEIKIKKL